LKIPKGLTQHENPDKFRVIFRRAHDLHSPSLKRTRAAQFNNLELLQSCCNQPRDIQTGNALHHAVSGGFCRFCAPQSKPNSPSKTLYGSRRFMIECRADDFHLRFHINARISRRDYKHSLGDCNRSFGGRYSPDGLGNT
jgi:hypothetical protein